jgi:hypothetical protein
MIAHKTYHCDCGCEGPINPGDEFRIEDGFFYLKSHSSQQPLQIQPVVSMSTVDVPGVVPTAGQRVKSGKKPVTVNAVQLSLFD